MAERCNAQATVDVLREPPRPGFLGMYSVEVMGRQPYDFVRKYVISAKDEARAAFEAMDRFRDEMESGQ